MAGSVNKVILVGRLGRDPEVKTTTTGKVCATLSLATSEQWTGRNGEKQEKTEWHRVIAWERLAEIAEKYMGKGQLLYVEGSIETRKWQDQNGQDRYSTEIKARTIQMLERAERQHDEDGQRVTQKHDVIDRPADDTEDDDIPF